MLTKTLVTMYFTKCGHSSHRICQLNGDSQYDSPEIISQTESLFMKRDGKTKINLEQTISPMGPKQNNGIILSKNFSRKGNKHTFNIIAIFDEV